MDESPAGILTKKITFCNGNRAQVVVASSTSRAFFISRALNTARPGALVVLVGGAGGISLGEMQSLRPLFVNVLAPLAQSLGAVVVDGGTDAGVMRLMGQARSEIGAEFPLIGVAAAGTVALPGGEPFRPKASPLESHHTHFVLVPGSEWGDESPWLDRMANSLARRCPRITVLINGGNISRKDVENSLASKRPVLVVAGTGRLADELGAAQERPRLLKVVDIADGPDKLKESLTSLLKEASMIDKFDEYKFFAESTQHLSERRQAATGTYLTVNTAIFAILGFLVKDVGVEGSYILLACIPLFVVGCVACLTWLTIISQYKKLIGWRYDQLMDMEKNMPETHQMYLKEWESYFKPKNGKETFGFSIKEVVLPKLFMVLYIVAAVLIVLWKLGSFGS